METTPNRTPFILAGIAAVLASLYWAGLTLLILVSVAGGAVSPTQVILPVVLILLYAWRGVQLFKGDPAAARRILWLHGLGGIMALIGAFSQTGLIVVLQGVKVVIHVFGVATALWAIRTSDASRLQAAVARYP
jgi:hypothetical protein